MATSTVVQSVGRVGGGIFGKLLRIKFSFIVVSILLIQALAVGLTSEEPVTGTINELGERFFNMFENLNSASSEIVSNQAKFDGVLDMVFVFWELFSSVWMIYLWLKLFVFLSGKSPWSNESAGFINISFAIGLLYILQIGYLFFMRYEVGSEFLSGYSFFDIIKMPYYGVKNFILAIVYLFTSFGFKEKVQPVLESVPNLSNACTNPAGCVA